MRALLLERPIQTQPTADGLQPREALALLRRIERWLPDEEARLSRARRERRPEPRGEWEWEAMLGLYEQLSLALAPRLVRS